MSTMLRLCCETCDEEGPIMRVGWGGGGSIRFYGYPGTPEYGADTEDGGKLWRDFIEEHEYHDLRLRLT